MAPTIEPGEYILVSKFNYRFRSPDSWPLSSKSIPSFSMSAIGKPRINDIVLFYGPDSGIRTPDMQYDYLVKRCLGVPGDSVSMYKKHIVVNGDIIDKRDNLPYEFKIEDTLATWNIPKNNPGSFLLLGDNRNASYDSRFFGTISEDRFIGKAVMVVWPWPPRLLK